MERGIYQLSEHIVVGGPVKRKSINRDNSINRETQ